MAKSKIDQTVEWLPVRDLKISAPYQREVKMEKALAIAEEFDPDLFQVLVVSRRDDGSLWVLDGQHRVVALREMGWDDQEVICEVRDGLSYEEEASLHVDFQDKRRKHTAMTAFKGRLEAKDPMYVEIQEVLTKFGLQVAVGGGHDMVGSPTALISIYRHGGRDLLTKMFNTLINAWGVNKDAWNVDILKACAQVIAMYPDLDNAKFVKSLAKLRPSEYVRKGLAGKEVNRGALANNVTVAMVVEYNSILGGRKLAPPMEMLKSGARSVIPARGAGRSATRKLSDKQEQDIIKRGLAGHNRVELAKEYNVATSKIYKLLAQSQNGKVVDNRQKPLKPVK